MTIHITPEAGFSYVSLEMDVPQTNYPAFITKVINCFKPGKFMINMILPGRQAATKAKHRFLAGVNGSTNSATFGEAGAGATDIPDPEPAELANIHGLMVYGDLLEARFGKFRRCDLTLSHYKHSNIVYARYVGEGVS